MQGTVPLQAHHQTLQIGDDHLRANTLQSMHTTEIPHGRYARVSVTQRHHVDGIRTTARQCCLTDNAGLQMVSPQFNDALQRCEFR